MASFAGDVKSSLKRLGESYLSGAARAYRRQRDSHRVSGFPPVPTVFGLKLRGNPENFAAREHAADVSAMLTLMDGCDTFVDVGAYIGYYTCIAARKGKYAIALEPQPVNFEVLRRNLSENGLVAQSETHMLALSDGEGTAELFGGREGGSLLPGWAGIRPASQYRNHVPVRTLDGLLENRFLGDRLLINIDVEGNEYALMRGASRSLRRAPKPVWVVEIGLTENFPGSMNPHFLETFEFFWGEGYEAAPLTEPDRVLSRNEILSWIERREAGNPEIHYVFRGR